MSNRQARPGDKSVAIRVGEPFRTHRHLPPGHRIFAIGDVHGRSDLLNVLLAAIGQIDERMPAAFSEEVFLGDYIDRGMDSSGVIELLLGACPRRRILLKGNHEVMMGRFLETGEGFEDWRHAGGLQTLSSYGIGRPFLREREGIKRVWRELTDRIPQKHAQFIQNLWHYYRLGEYVFVHAGLRPGRSLEQQDPRDLFWIREEFLESNHDFGFSIVHGHTPNMDIDIRSNRIGIDTGAYATNKLTCLLMEDDLATPIQTYCD